MKSAKSETPKTEEPKKAAAAPSSGGASGTPLRGVAATGDRPSGGSSTTAPTATANPSPSAAAATTARTPATGNDSQLKVNHSLLTQLLSFGYTQV
jgi:hypothetical protein